MPKHGCRKNSAQLDRRLWEASYRGNLRGPTNAPAALLRTLFMSLLNLWAGCTVSPKEMAMEWFAAIPEWWVWCAAGAAGAIALATLASILEAAFELDAG